MNLATHLAPLGRAARRVDEALGRAAAAYPFALPWSLGAMLAIFCYYVVFAVTTDMNVGRTVTTSLINVVTVWGLGFAVREVVHKLIVGRSLLYQIGAHGGLAVIFSLAWYLLTISLLGWRDGSLLEGTIISSFRGVAFVWQIFQGLALYGAAAALAVTAAVRQSTVVAAPPASPTSPAFSATIEARPDRLLIRIGDEIRSIDVADVILIAAADDYSEIVTPTARHLSRKSLGEYEAELPSSFVRVHRSTLVNLDRLVSAEPAGVGRLTLHLAGGESVVASRAGARLIRERAS